MELVLLLGMREQSKFHGSYRWKKARKIARITAAQHCQRCGAFLPEPGALHVHHRKPVKHAPALGLEPLNFMVVCGPCHNILEPRTGTPRFGCDVTGQPLDPRHPWNTCRDI